MPGPVRHAGALGLFAALTIGWTWPLILHLADVIPGGPGDNYSFVWNLWWMRHVLATPDLEYFRTTYLFAPFGVSIANHPHTALQALFAATALRSLSIVTAQNIVLLICVFANMAGMYALAWTRTHHRRASILAGVIFGLSPYLAVHLLGHFDLMAAAVVPLFALLLIRAVERGSNVAAIGAGLVLAATAYGAYYYVVYIALFAAVYLLVWTDAIAVSWSRRVATHRVRLVRGVLVVAIVLLGASAVAIVVTGGATVALLHATVSMHQPHNPLTAMWIAVIAWIASHWRVTVAFEPDSSGRIRRAARVACGIVAVFAVACAPLIRGAAQLVARGEYVSQTYFWRSVPRGVDAIAPFLGHPRHPLTRDWTQRAYASMNADDIETVGWLGIVPLLLLSRVWRRDQISRDIHVWSIVGAVFLVWALGPFLTVKGVDVGLWLPEVLARYVPFVSNARMPGRAMAGVFMAAAMLIAASLSRAKGTLGSPAIQWLLVALVAFEYWDAPIPLTTLDRPAGYVALAGAPPGAVCEAPFGIGDGLDAGIGPQDRRVLFYATVHEHPLVGGYIGRMPPAARQRYLDTPVVGALLRLSDRRSSGIAESIPREFADCPCQYIVVNRATAAPALRAYLARLPLEWMASDNARDVYRLVPQR